MTGTLPRTVLGRTGLVVTRFGIGGAYCTSVEGYGRALDCGVTYVDTARAYRDGDDEKVIGQAIQGRRDDLVLATKTTQRDAEGARRDLETSLRLLGTDHVDLYQLHHLNTQEEREQALGKGGALEAVLRARSEGLVRFVGVTGHDWTQVALAVATGLFDTVLCWYNCAMRGAESAVFPAARQHGVGVVIMSAGRNDKLFGGTDAPAPEQFYRYVLGHAGVHVALLGLRDVERFTHIAQALEERDALTPEERQSLETYGSRMLAEGKVP